MRDEVVNAIETYLQGLKNRDLSKAPFAPSVTFESPLSPKLIGANAVIEFLTGLFPAIQDMRVKATYS